MTVAGDVVEMRRAIAAEKGDSERWDLKYAAGGLVDLEFIAQYLQLVHAAEQPEILDTSTARVLDKAWRLGLLAAEDADVLRPAARLYHEPDADPAAVPAGPFDPKAAGRGAARPAGARRRRAGFRRRSTRISPRRRRACAELQSDFRCGGLM